MIKKIYVAGSLRNPDLPLVGNAIRAAGFDAFDDWFAGGEIADDEWMKYERTRGRDYKQGLFGHAARHIFEFDQFHLRSSDALVLVLPAGKSAHLEMGYLCGLGKPTWVLFKEEPERWDVMYQFAEGIFYNIDELIADIKRIDRQRMEGHAAWLRETIRNGSTEYGVSSTETKPESRSPQTTKTGSATSDLLQRVLKQAERMATPPHVGEIVPMEHPLYHLTLEKK